MKRQAYRYVFSISLNAETASGLTYDHVLQNLHRLSLKSFSIREYHNVCIVKVSLSKKLVLTSFQNNFLKSLNRDKVLPHHLTIFYAIDTKAFENCFSNAGRYRIDHYRANKPV